MFTEAKAFAIFCVHFLWSIIVPKSSSSSSRVCPLYSGFPSQNPQKKPTRMYQALVQSILQYGAETWSLNTQQANKLLATEMDFWRRSDRKSRKEKVLNVTIREIMEVGKNIL
jgi:hypothetical protein